jgi:signal transduction histidine kinase
MNTEPTHAYVEELEQRVATLSRLLEVSSVLNAALLKTQVRIDPLLSYLMDAAADITGSEGASVLLWDEERDALYFAATTSTSERAHDLVGKSIPLDSIAGSVFRERTVVQVDDTADDPRHYTQVDRDIEFVTRSLLGVPMIARDKVIGVLEVVNKRQLPWIEADRSNLLMLASEAAVAIQVARLLVDLKNANEELSGLDTLKNNFIAIASHELRTPLGIILGYASFLQEAKDIAVSDHASKVMDSALQLRRIIEDMINLRYLKQKPGDLQLKEVTLNTLVDDLQRDVLTIINANDHNLEVQCDDGEVFLSVDRGRISMALSNVMNNAVAFTPPGGTISIRAHAPNAREAWINVTDTGIGLRATETEKIFDEFYQVEDHMTRRHGGLGIGLSITRALIEAHGGKVWASSPGVNQGTTFTIMLPLAEPPDS